MKVIITGASGMLGTALLQHTVDDNINEYFTDRIDLLDYNKFEEYVSRIQPDVVIHLASRVGGLYENIDTNFQMLTENTRIHINVVNVCLKLKVPKLVNILSTCIFPSNAPLPLNIKNMLDSEPHESNHGYSYSKRFLYIASKLLTDTIVINLVPTNLYGPNDKSTHVLPDLMRLYSNNPDEIIVRGSGNARRQFLYSGDFAKIILKSINLDESLDLIISPPESEEVSIKELVKLIGFKNISFDTMYSDGQLSKTCTDSDVKKYFPDIKLTPLIVGLGLVKHSLR